MKNFYRTEIDGLRAIAVIPVVLFHSGLELFSGGYVGVDIFFVISGYLISNIILGDIKEEKFSILSFYERRIRRIFPALFFVLFCTSIVALCLMLPSELNEYGKSLFSATLFYANYHFMFDAGYFTGPAETQPLLHMWSLAVEEQFYILFPLFLLIVSKITPGLRNICTWALLMFSFVYSLWLFSFAPEDAFYSAPARAWELLAGAVLALLSARNKQPRNEFFANILSILGLLLICIAIFTFDTTTYFPNYAAILPVLGTALILYAAGFKNNLVGRILSLSPLRFFGNISFSLYLWHWPVIVLSKLYVITPISDIQLVLLLLVTTLLAYLTWFFVETPFRKRAIGGNRRAILLFGSSSILLSSFVGAAFAITDGFPQRFSEKTKILYSAANDAPKFRNCSFENINSYARLRKCEFGAKTSKKERVVVWGDSHGEALLPAIDKSAKENGVNGFYFGRGGCLPLLDVHQIRQEYRGCVEEGEKVLDFMKNHPEISTVILVARWAQYSTGVRYKGAPGHDTYIKDSLTIETSFAENKDVFLRGFERTLARLDDMGKDIVLVSQVPETEYDIPAVSARLHIFEREMNLKSLFKDYIQRQEYVNLIMEQLDNEYPITLVRPELAICDSVECNVFDSGIPIYRDNNHLARFYAEKISYLFDPLFNKE
ncbi:MAG: peptidoglycan/LPS O-acetylase OafA/YrhL [Paraglaciecola sp.]|jgi:peptidoglycan/LPS O-acetylase OafA/YrhL